MGTTQKRRDYMGFAFRQSVPVMLGYIFLGIAFGLLLQNAGYNFIWAFFASLIIYAGSMEFVLVNLLADVFYQWPAYLLRAVLCGEV